MTDLKHVFDGYRADFQRTRDWVIINWHHPDINENNHQITYIVNEFTGELHISGDVGEAIFHRYIKLDASSLTALQKERVRMITETAKQKLSQKAIEEEID